MKAAGIDVSVQMEAEFEKDAQWRDYIFHFSREFPSVNDI
jgi:hypothetical protein